MFFCLAYCDIRKGIYLAYNDIASLSFKFNFQRKKGYLKKLCRFDLERTSLLLFQLAV